MRLWKGGERRWGKKTKTKALFGILWEFIAWIEKKVVSLYSKHNEDYLTSRHLSRWEVGHARYDGMLKFCRQHNGIDSYQPFFEKWTAEEMANIALTLCHMVDRMMTTYQKQREQEFITEGGIKERMTAARLGYRTNQREEIARLKQELDAANRRIVELERILKAKEG